MMDRGSDWFTGEPDASKVTSPVRRGVVGKGLRKQYLAGHLPYKGTWSGPEAPNSSGAVVVPPAERRDLTHTGTSAERGKPVVSPNDKALSLGKAPRKRSRRGGG